MGISFRVRLFAETGIRIITGNYKRQSTSYNNALSKEGRFCDKKQVKGILDMEKSILFFIWSKSLCFLFYFWSYVDKLILLKPDGVELLQ